METQTVLSDSHVSKSAYPSHLKDEVLPRIISSLAFPPLTWNEFQSLPDTARKEILGRNRIINTDTYNRTMCHLAGKEKAALAAKAGPHEAPALALFDQATYTLQLRRAPHGFLIACGIEDFVESLTMLPITQNELTFAREYYKHTTVPFFAEELWSWIVNENKGVLPIEIRGLRDGHVVAPGDPVLTITGPSELVAHFEQKVHRVFYECLVAAQAKVLVDIISDPNRFIEVGLRGAINDDQHLKALRAIAVGGGFRLTSNDAAVGMYGMRDVGTIGHRYIQRFEDSEESSFRFALDNLPSATLLVDLVDTYAALDVVLKLKQEYRQTATSVPVRLDSGDLLDQARYYLRKAVKLGFTDPKRDKVTIEGFDSISEVKEIEAALTLEFGRELVHALVVYGAGSLLISDRTSRSDASSGFKLSAYTSSKTGKLLPTMKFSNSPGKQSLPGSPELAELDGERIVLQREELGCAKPLFDTLFSYGRREGKSSLEEAHARVLSEFPKLTFSEVKGGQVAKRAIMSGRTQYLEQLIRSRYGLPAIVS